MKRNIQLVIGLLLGSLLLCASASAAPPKVIYRGGTTGLESVLREGEYVAGMRESGGKLYFLLTTDPYYGDDRVLCMSDTNAKDVIEYSSKTFPEISNISGMQIAPNGDLWIASQSSIAVFSGERLIACRECGEYPKLTGGQAVWMDEVGFVTWDGTTEKHWPFPCDEDNIGGYTLWKGVPCCIRISDSVILRCRENGAAEELAAGPVEFLFSAGEELYSYNGDTGVVRLSDGKNLGGSMELGEYQHVSGGNGQIEQDGTIQVRMRITELRPIPWINAPTYYHQLTIHGDTATVREVDTYYPHSEIPMVLDENHLPLGWRYTDSSKNTWVFPCFDYYRPAAFSKITADNQVICCLQEEKPVAETPVEPADVGETVSVTLPDFPVTLNGLTTANTYSKYPLIVYQDITYFPMTYYDCRLLGLTTGWSEEGGLAINDSQSTFSEYIREIQDTPNAKQQTAQIATGVVYVNNVPLDNSQEPYPLLLFRDVTYFPMTWRFAVDRFGWEYSFDAKNGLAVTNPRRPLIPDKWCEEEMDEGTMIMGTGNLKIVCNFSVSADSRGRPSGSIGLYNKTGKDITLAYYDPWGGHPWEYQIYKVIGEREELVYRQALDFYSGEIPAGHWVHWTLPDGYWSGMSREAGEYRCVLVPPEEYRYREAGSEEYLTTPVYDEGAYAIQFSHPFTVEE